MRLVGLSLLLVASSIVLPARNLAMAQTPTPVDTGRPATEYDRCMASGDAAMGITVGILDCIHAEIHRQDVRLNRAYRTTMARLDPVRRQKLKAAERRWIKHREVECNQISNDQAGGTMWLIIYNGCIMNEEQDRAGFLEAYR